MKELIFTLTVLILVSTTFPQPPGKLARLDSIRAAIRIKRANWTADLNPIFLLPDDEFKNLLGALPPDTTNFPRWQQNFSTKATLDLPDSFDWRNYQGRDWMTPIRNQDGCGSCWAFATIGAWEADINIALDSAEYDPNLAEQQLVSCWSGGSCSGGNFAGYYLRTTGVFDEACFPYSASDEPCDNRCADWEDRILFRALNTSYAGGSEIDNMKALVQIQPTYTTMSVYSDFTSYSGGVYEHTWGDYQGGHAVVILGWNDADSCWICKNSWGTGWGESGYFRIKYHDSEIGYVGYRMIVGARL
ncbi:hypothetical protein DRQ26_06550, partial [bacterium]